VEAELCSALTGTGDARADHLAHAAWVGEQLALDASVLPAQAA